MNFKNWLLENTTLSFIDKLSALIDKNAFKNVLSRATPKEIKEVISWGNEINRMNVSKILGTPNPVVLYHGTTPKHMQNINKEGLKVTKGKRTDSAFGLGDEYEIENQGIFLTDSKSIARYFGDNRSEFPNDGRTYEVYVNLNKILDITSLKMSQKLMKIALNLLSKKHGENIKKLRSDNSDTWRLLDIPEFIQAVKNDGWKGIKFKEDTDIHKDTSKEFSYKGGANTYLIFDAKDTLLQIHGDVIKNIDDVFDNLPRKTKHEIV